MLLSPNWNYKPPRDVPAQLYRHFDHEGHLLYVGIALNAFARLKQHRIGSYWYHAVATVTIQNFSTRADAARAETHAIKTEKPLYNSKQSAFPECRYRRSFRREASERRKAIGRAALARAKLFAEWG